MRLRFTLPILAILALAVPASAQNGQASMAVFMTIDVKDTEEFEESLAEHNQWHASQGDTWSWVVYQALGGDLEYAVVTPNHEWSDFDNPVVDMAVDQAQFANSDAAQLVTSEELWLWEGLPEYGNAPPEPMPIVQVLEFEVTGNEEAFLHAMKKFKEATAGTQGAYFQWARVLSNDKPTTYFVAVWANSFAQLGAPGPTPLEILRAAHGATETGLIMEGFQAAATNTSNRVWLMRPDLSYIPD